MSLRNEILEGVAVYKALSPTAYDKYYGEMYEKAKRENAIIKENDRIKKEDEERAKQGLPPINRAAPPPTVGAPNTASTSTPGSPPTMGNAPNMAPLPATQPSLPPPSPRAMSTNAFPTIHPLAQEFLQGNQPDESRYGRMRRGGRVSRYADGGVVRNDDLPDDDEVMADRRVLEFLQRNPSQGPQQDPMEQFPRPGTLHLPQITPGQQAERATEDRFQSNTPGVMQRDAQAFQTQPPFVHPSALRPDPTPPSRPRTPVTPPSPNFGPLPARNASDLEVVGEKARANMATIMRPSTSASFTQQPPEEREPEPTPAAAPAAVPPPEKPTGLPMPPVTQQQQAVNPTSPWKPPSVITQRSAPPTPPPAAAPAARGPGTTGPGMGNGNVPAPPVGASSANAPSTAPKPPQRPALNVQSRQEAYDPIADARDPDNKFPVDEGGRSNSPEAAQVMRLAMQAMPPGPNGGPPAVGAGANSRGVYQQFVQANNQGGRLTPGMAALVGMTSSYRHFLQNGMPGEAAKMAMSIMQAANLEAASMGHMARDQLMGGDQRSAAQTAVNALNTLPDGTVHSLSPDGSTLITRDRKGTVIAQTPMDGRHILAIANGIADGSALWRTLQQSVEMIKPPDKNAEGRALSNDIKRNQILLQRKRLAGGGGAGKSGSASNVDALFGGINRGSTGGNEGQGNVALSRLTSQLEDERARAEDEAAAKLDEGEQ